MRCKKKKKKKKKKSSVRLVQKHIYGYVCVYSTSSNSDVNKTCNEKCRLNSINITLCILSDKLHICCSERVYMSEIGTNFFQASSALFFPDKTNIVNNCDP